MSLAIVTYESPFAPCGGIAAVMKYLPAALMEKVGSENLFVFTPFHHRIEKTVQLAKERLVEFEIETAGEVIACDLYLHREECDWLFVSPRDPRIFAGEGQPYAVGANLLRDCGVFGQAVVRAAAILRPEEEWVFLLQDWEAATVALETRNRLPKSRCFLTLHNSYDCPIGKEDLIGMGLNPKRFPGETVLQCSLPHIESPILTVSHQFALDLTREYWQAEVIAPHLQKLLKGNLKGIDNGPFAASSLSPSILRAAEAGNLGLLKSWKTKKRKKFLASLETLSTDSKKPVWGNPESFRPDNEAWFVMAGRDDPRQKGYDVAALAIQRFLFERKRREKFLFFPIPGEEGLTGLSFLEELASRFPENVLVFPFLFREGFLAALQGSTFGLMPSFYEPFGMANEFYLNGTMGIGRATGGIVEQIVPLLPKGGSEPLQRILEIARASGWYGTEQAPTGFLFRETALDAKQLAKDWRFLNEDGPDRSGIGNHRAKRRAGLPLIRSMVEELARTLEEAVRLWEADNRTYYRMLVAGVRHIQTQFSWEKAAQEYLSLLARGHPH